MIVGFLCGYMKEKEEKHILIDSNFELKESTDGKTMVIEGYAAYFNNMDSHRDIILPTAFDRFLKSAKIQDILVCYYHNEQDIIGDPIEVKTDDKGLYVKFELNDTTKGIDAAKLVKRGRIKSMSIGYYAMDFRYEVKDGVEVRYLEDIELVEWSLLARPSNPMATIDKVGYKGFSQAINGVQHISDDQLTELKSAVEKEYQKRIYSKLIL